jgi:hypothetical protein
MNARVLLLVLVTAGFMAAWNGDQTAMQAALASRAAAADSIVSVSPADQPAAGQPGPLHRLTVAEPVVTADEATHSHHTADCQLPAGLELPTGIAAGSYQAVDQQGTSVQITVSEAQATGEVARDFFVADASDGKRWYLIRILKD